MVRHLRHGRRFEKSRDLELDLSQIVDVAENAGSQERVAPRREEVIVNADLLDSKDLRPALCQLTLERSPRRHKGLPRFKAAREPELIGQPDPLDFAGGALGDALDDDDLTRDLEIRDASHGKL